MKHNRQLVLTEVRLSVVAGVLLSLLGIVVLTGWFSKNISLTQVSPQFMPMQFNTALGFFFSGLGLIFLNDKRKNLNKYFGSLVSTLGFLTLIEYIFNINLGLDELFMSQKLTILTSSPGRMAPVTALCFLLSGANLVLYRQALTHRINTSLYLAFASLVCSLGLISFFGYFIKTNNTIMAMHTSVGFVVLGFGQLLWLWHNFFKLEKLHLDYITLPVGIGILTIILITWQTIEAEKNKRLEFDRSLHTKQLERNFIYAKNFEREMQRFAFYWQQRMPDSSRDGLFEEATIYINDFPELKAIGLINEDFNIDIITSSNNYEHFMTENFKALPELSDVIQNAVNKNSSNAIYSEPIFDDEIGNYYIILHPLFQDDIRNGFLISILDISVFINNILEGINKEYFVYEFYDNYSLLHQASHDKEINSLFQPMAFSINLENREWKIEFSPTALYVESFNSSLPRVLLIGGFLFSLAGMLVTWLIQRLQVQVVLQKKTLKDKENASTLVYQEEARYRSIINTVLDGIIIINNKGVIQSFNPQAEKIFGYKSSEVIGENVSCLMPDSYARLHDKYLHNAYTTGETRILGKGRILLAQRKDKTTLPVRIRVSEINLGGERMFTGAVSDITNELANEEKLKKNNQELQYSNEALRQFAYVASHDLQEPLRVVASYAKLLEQRYEGQLDEKADKFIEYIVDGASRMQSMIKSLLSYSQVGTGANEFKVIPLLDSFQLALDNMSHTIEEHQCDIQYDPQSFPEIMGDKDQLGMVFQNLISNAIKYRSEKPPEIQIKIVKKANTWIISVKDNGIGFEEKYASRVFEIFQRLHSNHHSEGNGIGLAICSKIIERHGGTLSVKSEPGIGSEFSFTLNSSI